MAVLLLAGLSFAALLTLLRLNRSLLQSGMSHVYRLTNLVITEC